MKGTAKMLIQDLEKELMKLAQDARGFGYTVTTPELFVDPVYGNKLAYYQHASNKIVIHDDFVENGTPEEVENTLKHELAHAIAEQNRTTKKMVWHGEAWKLAHEQLGGNSERYHAGQYQKPAYVKKTMKELYSIQPKHPADRWETGTYKQWLSRGYHVMKGQKGQLKVWQFVGQEFEKDTDGETHTGLSTARAIVFEANQVEANEKKGE